MAVPTTVSVEQMLVGGPRIIAGSETIATGATSCTIDFSGYGSTGVFMVFYTFEGAAVKQPIQAASTTSATSTTVVFTFSAPGASSTLKYIVILR